MSETRYEAIRAFISTLVNKRSEESEAFVQTLFDRLNARLDQTERSVHERLERIEKGS